MVTVRNSAMPEFEKSRTSVRYLFISCDDGALNDVGEEPDDREEHEATAVPGVEELAHRRPREISGSYRDLRVARRLGQVPCDRAPRRRP